MSRFFNYLIAALLLFCTCVAAQPPDTVTIGHTWYETQRLGSIGRMNTLEPNGWRQFCWTKGENNGASIRHVWWNGIDPNGVQVFPGNGVAVEATTRGGFPTMDVISSGAGVIGFQGYQQNTPLAFVSVDYIPHTGAFFDGPLPPIAPGILVGPPRVQIGWNGRLQIIASGYTLSPEVIPKQWYLSGTWNASTYTFDWDPAWTFVDSTWSSVIPDLVTALSNNRLAAAWARTRGNPPRPDDGNLLYVLDPDGLNPDFAHAINLTHFIPPDPSLLPDTLAADRDTLRLHNDVCLFFDQNDHLHIAFTTRSYFYFQGASYWNASLIWHWSDQWPDSFRVIGGTEYYAYNNNINCGVGNLKAQRPTLTQTPNGYLYCAYQVYDTDTTRLSASGWPSGEIYVSVSTDGGMNWSQGTDVTNTITPHLAPAGQCRSEICPSMAKRADAGYLHLQYVYDLDAGDVIFTEGSWTNNPVKYHRVPVAQIPTIPLVVQNKHLHVTPTPQFDVTMTLVSWNFGVLVFRAAAVNHGPNQVPFWVWGRIKYPNGTYTAPTIGPVQINPPVGVTLSRQRSQTIPGSWPAGVYTYLGYANQNYSYPALDSSWFTFTKLAGDNNTNPFEPAPYSQGEPFPGELALSSQPLDFSLSQAIPNPFNATTALSFKLQAASRVSLKVYDSAGRLVTTLVEGWREAGNYEVIFDGSKLASGVYLYKLKAGDNHTEGKMVLMK